MVPSWESYKTKSKLTPLSVPLPHVPATIIPNLVLTYRKHLTQVNCPEMGFRSGNWYFSSLTYPLKIRFFLTNKTIMHTIVFLLLFKNLNVFGIDIWEKVKPGPTKVDIEKLILDIINISDLWEWNKDHT